MVALLIGVESWGWCGEYGNVEGEESVEWRVESGEWEVLKTARSVPFPWGNDVFRNTESISFSNRFLRHGYNS